MSYDNPKPPFVATQDDSYARVVNAHGVSMAVWLKAAFPDWAERQAAALAELTERFTPKPRWTWKYTSLPELIAFYDNRVHAFTAPCKDSVAQARCDAWNALEAGQ